MIHPRLSAAPPRFRLALLAPAFAAALAGCGDPELRERRNAPLNDDGPISTTPP